MAPLPITFLSDYGLEDEFVGVCHAVIRRVVPDAALTDLSHGIPRHDVDHGAEVLARALPYAPPGVHLAVVDPGVGSRRRGVALRTVHQGRLLVGPDNGLLIPAADRFGGVSEASDISLSPFRLEPASASFHGRDIFAPVAATLAQGGRLAEVGEPLPPNDLERPERTRPRISRLETVAHVRSVDRFGNLTLDLPESALPETGLRLGHPVTLELDGRPRIRAMFARTFSEVGHGEALAYVDSWSSLAIAVNRGDAAQAFGLSVGDPVRLLPAKEPAERQSS